MTQLYPLYVPCGKEFDLLRKMYENIQDEKVLKETSVTAICTKFALPCVCIFRDFFEADFLPI